MPSLRNGRTPHSPRNGFFGSRPPPSPRDGAGATRPATSPRNGTTRPAASPRNGVARDRTTAQPPSIPRKPTNLYSSHSVGSHLTAIPDAQTLPPPPPAPEYPTPPPVPDYALLPPAPKFPVPPPPPSIPIGAHLAVNRGAQGTALSMYIFVCLSLHM